MLQILTSLLLIVAAASAASPPAVSPAPRLHQLYCTVLYCTVQVSPAPRLLDQFATGFMLEDGKQRAAAPECKGGLGWVYYNGHCYMFTRFQRFF